jgi:small subunit ribosomal protein S7
MAEEEKEKIAIKKSEAKNQKIAEVNAIKEETIVEQTSKDSNLAKAQKIQKAAPTALLFEKYSYDVVISDISLKNYINLKPLEYPTTLRTDSQKMFSKININIIERLENSLMKGGTGGKISGKVIRTKGSLQGKKLKVMHLIEKAFDKVHKNTGQNPIQIFINALENSAPIEDTTRVRYGGIISNVAVDVSASRRLDIALRNIAYATIIGAFASKRNFVDTLSNEIILAAKNDVNSYAIKRKNEIERMARSAK